MQNLNSSSILARSSPDAVCIPSTDVRSTVLNDTRSGFGLPIGRVFLSTKWVYRNLQGVQELTLNWLPAECWVEELLGLYCMHIVQQTVASKMSLSTQQVAIWTPCSCLRCPGGKESFPTWLFLCLPLFLFFFFGLSNHSCPVSSSWVNLPQFASLKHN